MLYLSTLPWQDSSGTPSHRNFAMAPLPKLLPLDSCRPRRREGAPARHLSAQRARGRSRLTAVVLESPGSLLPDNCPPREPGVAPARRLSTRRARGRSCSAVLDPGSLKSLWLDSCRLTGPVRAPARPLNIQRATVPQEFRRGTPPEVAAAHLDLSYARAVLEYMCCA